MTTLTERLRELVAEDEATINGHKGHFDTAMRASAAVALAQELHALLVECELGFRRARACTHQDSLCRTTIDRSLTKLKQAGIV